ncbi:MAG: phosphoribosyltransferase, partial [Pseudomonadota bacterium]
MSASYEYVSWNRFYRLCGVLYHRIDASGFRPDLIIAIARGGYPVARVLADYFDIMDLVSLKVEHYRGPEKMPAAVVRYPLAADVSGRQVLVVDDVSDTGESFAAALRHIGGRGRPAALRTAVLHHKQTSEIVPDFIGQRIIRWRWISYPWSVV